MQVIHVNSAKAWGGGEAHTLLLATGLRARGCAVTLVCRPKSALAARAQAAGLAVVTLPLRGALDLASCADLRRLCREREARIVHAHLARDYPLLAAIRATMPTVRTVVTRHVLFPMRAGVLSQWVWRHIDRLIAVSDAAAAVVRVHPAIRAAQIVTIANGIDTARYAAVSPMALETLGVPPGARLLATVGTLVAHKGQETVLRALTHVRDACPDVVLLLVGEDKDEGRYRQRLEVLVAQLGMGEAVRFLGLRDDVPQVLRACTALVQPSEHESFGLVAVEAMAAGLPVVAGDVGGFREVVADGETGRLVPPGDPAALAESLIDLLTHPETAQAWGAAGQLRAREDFDAGVMCDRTLTCYQELQQ